jgi:hypothetical protein
MPKFEKHPERFSGLLSTNLRVPLYDPPAMPRIGANVSSPSYRKGSAIVEVKVKKLQHALPADMADDDFWHVSLVEAGSYALDWTVYSDDLEEPAKGELGLLVTDVADETPIRSLEELRGGRHSGRQDAGGDGNNDNDEDDD